MKWLNEMGNETTTRTNTICDWNWIDVFVGAPYPHSIPQLLSFRFSLIFPFLSIRFNSFWMWILSRMFSIALHLFIKKWVEWFAYFWIDIRFSSNLILLMPQHSNYALNSCASIFFFSSSSLAVAVVVFSFRFCFCLHRFISECVSMPKLNTNSFMKRPQE